MGGLGGIAMAIGAVLMAAGVQGGPRLSGQRLEGARRVCVYGQGTQIKERQIGSGEPCALYYREPTEDVEYVPALAVRVGETGGIGRTICTYRYAGREYRTVQPALQRCPLTPSGAMRVDGSSAPRG